MTEQNWQLLQAVDAIIFDCDGTLSHLEGIDALAEMNGVAEPVQKLTEMAMNELGITADLYEQRLDLVKPTQQQLGVLADDYYAQLAPHMQPVMDILAAQNKALYVVSAGLTASVLPFAKRLGVPADNVFAVGLQFDENGCYQDFERQSPLIHRNGKREIVSNIVAQHGRVIHIGDGMNDVEAMDLVSRFIGYGGKFYRQKIASLCEFYVTAASMLPVLSLCLTAAEVTQLDSAAKQYVDAGIALLEGDGVELR